MIATVYPSGDRTGVKDHAELSAVMLNSACIHLAPGEYFLSKPVVSQTCDKPFSRLISIVGSGQGTILNGVSADEPIIRCIASPSKTIAINLRLENLELRGGKHGLDLSLASYIYCHNVTFRRHVSHGVLVRDGGWIMTFLDSEFFECGGDGVNSIGTERDQNGNNLTFTACRFAANKGRGVAWSACGLNVNGCLFEGNAGGGVYVSAENRSASGVSIHGCYMERNGDSAIHVRGKVGFALRGIDIAGNYIAQPKDVCIMGSGDLDTVRGLVLHKSNVLVSTGDNLVDFGAVVARSVIYEMDGHSRYKFWEEANEWHKESNPYAN